MVSDRSMHGHLTINGRNIGADVAPYVVAEAGVNHNGHLDIAKDLAKKAKEAGADAVKFQTFQAETLATNYAATAEYQRKFAGEGSQLDMLKKLELKRSDYVEIMEFCKSINITCFSTPFSRHDADFLNTLNVPAFKVSSGDLVSLPFLEYMAKLSKPMIISTGMGNMQEVKEAVSVVGRHNKQLALLQCTSIYPCDLQYMHLNAITELQKLGYPVGLSDHSEGIGCAIIAVFRGACIIEKHLTLDKNMNGPDHSASLDPNEFAKLTQGVKEIYNESDNRVDLVAILEKYEPSAANKIDLILGSSQKKPSPPEHEMMLKGRKSIVASRDLIKGFRVPNDLESVLGVLFELKRPGTGLKPAYLYKILGKTLTRDIKVDEQLSLSDFQ